MAEDLVLLVEAAEAVALTLHTYFRLQLELLTFFRTVETRLIRLTHALRLLAAHNAQRHIPLMLHMEFE